MAEEKTASIEIELEDAQLLKLALDAHEKDITLNQHMNEILRLSIDQYEMKEDEFKKHMDKKMKEYEKEKAKKDAKDGTKSSVRDDKQQVVSASK